VCFGPFRTLKFEIKLGLKEFSVFGEDPQNLCSLVKNSLDWDFFRAKDFLGMAKKITDLLQWLYLYVWTIIRVSRELQ